MKSLLRYFFLLFAISLFSFQESQARVDIIHISTNDPQCFGSNDGYVTIDSLTTTAPSGPYLIRINTTPVQSFNVGDTVQLRDGNFTITVFDLGDGNTPTFRSFSINEPFQLVTALVSTTTSCFGVCDGDATVFAFDGTPAYSYEWSTSDTTQTIDSLCAGQYFVTVTDANNCTAVDSVVVNEPSQIQPNVSVTDVDCFGNLTGSATSNPTGGTGTYVNYQWSSSGNNTATEGNLSAGTYTVTVTDDDGCTGVETFNVSQPSAALDVSIANSNDVDCFGDSTGSATAQATGGTSPYTYQWDDYASQPTAQANNLPAGTYKVVVNDANGCLDSTTVTINQSPQATITISATDVNCNAGNDGSATASISGGTPNFSWVWSHGPNGSGSSTTVNNLTIGVYTVTFTDALSCTSVDSITVNEPTPINVQVDNQTDPLCNGGSDGSIDITTTGGTLPYNFSWSDGPTTEDRSGLSAGTYTLIVTDGNACEDTTVITLNDPPLLTASIDSLEDASCNGFSDGYIRVAANGGTGSYTYNWSNAVPTADNPNIPAGTYIVTVTDANGCTALDSGTVSEPALLTASVNTTDASCGGAADGTASVSVNGGTSPYSYLWSTSDTTASIANLTAGNYSVTVTDANGCTEVASGNVGEPTPLNLTLSSSDLLCNGDGSGAASASVSGGTPTYTYLWNDPSNQTSATANNLDAGLYSVTVTDANGCSIVDSINVDEPSVLTANINTSSNPSCNGGNDGSATVTPAGGVGTYTYTWDDPLNQTTATASNLSSGTYTVTVSDGNGCTAIDQITLSNPLAIQLTTDSISDVSCNGGNDGSIFLTTSNGTPPYNYSWSDGPFTTEDRTGLSASSYTVTVTDSGGCSIQQTFQITEPAQGVSITVDSTSDVSCNGNGDGSIDISVSGGTSPYNYLWSDSPTTEDRNGLNGGTYSITVTDANGCTSSQSININEPSPLDLSIDNVNDASCNGSANGSATVSATGGTTNYTFNWSNGGSGNTRTNLAAGVYIITVTDANGCQDVDSLVVGSPAAIAISVDSLKDVSCNGGNDGSVEVSASGGTPNYTYNWSNAVPGATNNNLSAGTYIVTVTDGNNCSDTLSVIINEPQPLSVVLNDTDESCVGENDGEITANGNGGTTPYTYLWSNSETTQTIDSLSPGTYSVTITDANGCTTGGSATINAASAILFNASATDVSCNGANDGRLVALAFGGAGGFSYSWSDGPSGGIRTNVAPGPYTVTATDANGCTAVASVTINEPDSLIPTLTVTDASCSGVNDGSISLNVSGGTIRRDYSYTWDNSLPPNPTHTGLSAGQYTVTVTDDNGCSAVETVNVGNVAPFTVSINTTDVSCNGRNDGAIDLTVTGTTGTPSFTWDNGLPSNEDQNNLTAQSYSVTVTDTSTGCIETAIIPISEPNTIVIADSVTPESCTPGGDGEIFLNVNGGTVSGNYAYSWDNSLPGQATQNGLTAGTYNVTVTDDNGCTASKAINVGSTAPFSVTSSVTNTSCNGSADGAIDLTVTGASGSLAYAWSNALAPQEDQNGLSAGVYSVTVTDSNSGCAETANITVGEPDSIKVTAVITNASCSPGNDGSIITTVTGGVVSNRYNYTWSNGINFQGDQFNLRAGTYTLTVTDDNGCFVIESFNVGVTPSFTVDSVITDASCNGGSDGAINLTINGSGGVPSFNWSNSLPPQEDQINLSAGTYSVTITDPNNGCTSTNVFSVDEPSPIVANFNITDESCTPGNDGEIDAIVNGGTSPYSFNWSNNSPNQSISNLSASVYYLTITDDNGCIKVDSAEVGSSAPFNVAFTKVDVSCNGGADGSIDLNITGTGGTPTFNWSNSLLPQEDQNNLSAGTYRVTITDPSDGCTETASISINEPTPLSVTFTTTAASCSGGNDGSASASASGGTSPYSYNWSNGNKTQTTSSLAQGTYSITVTDDNGCTIVDSTTINQGSNLSPIVNTTNESCAGNCDGAASVSFSSGQPPYTYSWSNGQGNIGSIGNLCAGSYDVSITDAVGCDTIVSFTIGSGVANYTIAATNESCLGSGCDGTASITTTGSYTYNWSPSPGAGQGTNQVSGLCAGKYFVTISNGSGCNVVDSVEIDPYSPILPNEVVTNESCGASCDGEISLSPSGGASNNYTYNWSPVPPNGQGVQTATGLCTGTYDVTITSPSSCDTVLTINIQSGNTLNADIVTQDQSCGVMSVCDGSAYATVLSGQAPYTYNWSVGTPTGADGDTVLSICAGTDYTVTITDANGCSVVDTFDIGSPTPITANFNAVNSTCNICDGELSVNANGGSGNYTYIWFDQNMDTLNSTSSSVTSLCAGIYFVEVTDDNGCSVILSTSLSDNGAESLSTSSVDVTCFGSCDGEASVNFNCSDPACQIDWIDASTGLSIGQSGNTATGLCAGDYFVEVINNSGCIALESITIAEPNPFVISENIIQPTCASSCSGSISLNVSGGSGGTYNYNWSPAPGSGQGTSTISNLCAGSYQVTVSDASGCDTVLSYAVGAPAAMTATFSTVNANCGQSDGSITATVNGGTVSSDYIYQWFDGNNNVLTGETDPVISNISAGNYTLRTEDDNQCVEFFTTVLGNIGGPSIIVDSVQDVDCFANNNGAAAISVSGGTSPYTYDWLPSGASTEDISGVSAGTYTVKVTDDNGCISTESVQINEGSQLDGLVETTNAACGACDGSAKLSLSGGSGSYTYLWSNGSTTDSTSNLCSGSHSVVATDSLGCSETFYFTINNNDGPSEVVVTATAASCASACDGTVQLQPVGGLPPYTYSWLHSPLDTNAFDNLCKGDYTVQVTDVRGCAKVVNFSIGSPASLSVTKTVTASGCNTFPCDGSIFLNVKGGTGPYSYNWGPTPQNDSNFIGNLCAGIYNVTVSDANACSEVLSMNVSNNGSTVSADPSASPESCFGSCDGSLVSGLTPSSSLSFQWLNTNGLAVTAQDNDLIGSACAGEYFLEVTSLPDGCITTYSVEVEAADSISLSASIVKPISCIDDCDGVVSVSSKGGELTFSYSWSDPNQQNVIPAEGLCAGIYTVTATDANGCSETLEVNLRNPDTLELDILAEGNVGCSSDCEGTASVLANGGNAPYSYNWSGGQTGTDPTDLCFGPNVITVTDATGCSVSDTVYISATDTVVAQVPTNQTYCEGDSIFLDGTIIGEGVISFGWYNADTTLFTTSEDTTIYRGVGDYRFILIASDGNCADTSIYDFTVYENPSVGLASTMALYKDEIKKIRLDGQDSVYQYSWNPATNLDDSTLAEPTTDTRETITYVLNLLDTTGCSISDSIRVVYYPDLEVPSGFSPNGDGTNDVWNIRLLEEFPNASVKVYNRWGELLFEQTNGYKEPWDGKFNGKVLPVGTYYYVIDLKDSRYENLTGPITLIK